MVTRHREGIPKQFLTFERRRGLLALLVVLPVAVLLAASRPAAARPPEATAALRQGVWLLEQWQTGDALRAFDRALALDPGFGDAWFQRGKAWYQAGYEARHRGTLPDPRQSRAAVHDFSQAIALHARIPEAFHARGLAWADLRDWHRAVLDYNEAIRRWRAMRDPLESNARSLAFVFNDRANAYMARGLVRLAIQDYSGAIRLNQRRSILERADAAYYNTLFLRNRARAFGLIGHRTDAQKDVQEAAALEAVYKNR